MRFVVLALPVLAGVALFLFSRRRRPASRVADADVLAAAAAGRPLTRDQLIAVAVHEAVNSVECDGVVTAVLPKDRYEVVFPDGRRLNGTRSTRLWRIRRKVFAGDLVRCLVSSSGTCLILENVHPPRNRLSRPPGAPA
jgi:translation initiation factor IF-1